MSDTECTTFLQWALPRLDMRWAGFRKVRGQVCKRLRQRMERLGLDGFPAYRARLESDPEEWRELDECCHITISRFFRDQGVFECLRRRVLPDIAARARREGREARCWSAGCASGEEPYTLKILWDLELAPKHPDVSLAIVATDIDELMLKRAHAGCFAATSLRELPADVVNQAFDRIGDRFCVRPRHRANIAFCAQDLRVQAPSGLFDLVLCRYLAFTYFSAPLQEKCLGRMVKRLRPRGYLVIGTHERLPDEEPRLRAFEDVPQIYQLERAAAVPALAGHDD